jgi:TolB-like protein/cytochrome c-type biogenesis protein CcmH/NrfG
MGDSKAVFLSYATQDAEAAREIRDALEAAGLEVWFDQSELRGGDAWDASIRKRIRDCALFVPIISANTESRSEGYFRLEWKLAVDRSHLMAEDQAFLMPVAIDGTTESTARVPDRFREIQWSRLAPGRGAGAFAERVQRLLASIPAAPAPKQPASPAGASPGAPSIAVLPFVNMSRDEENEYFADGLSEELLNVLSKIRGLRVASRTSAFFFKGKTIDIPTVAQKLNVAAILEGSVRKSGKRVRITAQLIEAASDSHLWSQTYDRDLEDIFAVQDDIAQSVVTELRATLLGDRGADAKAEVRAAATGRAENPDAHRLYLQGRFYVDRYNGPSVAQAVEYFRQALELEPGFALGWAGLGRALQIQAGYGWRPVHEGMREAREAAERALQLAPDLPEAHGVLGLVLNIYYWDLKGAARAFKRALEIAPDNADVLRYWGLLAGQLGQAEECLRCLRRSAALDPLSSTALRFLGSRCAYFGDPAEAERALRAALDLNPSQGIVHVNLCLVRLLQGRPAEALEFARREAVPAFRAFGTCLAEHALGHAAESDQALAELTTEPDIAYQVAEACSWRGETDRAFEWLERA